MSANRPLKIKAAPRVSSFEPLPAGNLLGIIVGGAKEALIARSRVYKLVWWNHKGFIRLALMHGVRRLWKKSEPGIQAEKDLL